MLANAYARLAQSKAESKDFESAYAFVSKGLEVDPNNIELNDLNTIYQSEANIIELTELFKTAISFPSDTKQKVNQIAKADPARFAQFSNTSESVLAERISTLRTSDENAAASLANNSASLFPASSVLADLKNQLQLKPWDQFTNANDAIKTGKLTLAQQIQQQAATEFAGHPQFVQFSDALAKRIEAVGEDYNEYLTEKDAAGNQYDDLRVAKKLLERVMKKWSDNPDYLEEDKSIVALIAQNKPVQETRIIKTEEPIDLEAATSAGSAGGEQVAEVWSPIPSPRDCTTRLAGYGKRSKAVCFDQIHQKARGPFMVVVPQGEGFDKPFAISKFEISVSDWSKYCILSGTCKPIKDNDRKNDPMTNITLTEAKGYATWLSERTGKTYRIPTKAEWEYAANAGGSQPKKDFNCRVSVQEKLIKGTGIVSVKSGKSNGWGLKNYVGNVQEWVLDGDSPVARGGAFTDAHSKCDISLERSHDGGADDTTGFRLIREDVG